MLFRTEFTVRRLRILQLPREGVPFDLGGPHRLRVTFRPPTEAEKGKGTTADTLIVAAESNWEPSGKVRGVFEDLVALRVPAGTTITDERDREWYLTEDGKLREGHPLALFYLPDFAQTATNQIHLELRDAIRKVVKLLRWRWSFRDPTTRSPRAAPATAWTAFCGMRYRRTFMSAWRGPRILCSQRGEGPNSPSYSSPIKRNLLAMSSFGRRSIREPPPPAAPCLTVSRHSRWHSRTSSLAWFLTRNGWFRRQHLHPS